MIKTQLVDKRNVDALLPAIIDHVKASPFTGLDCETQDSNRHEGLNRYCNYNPKTGRKAANTKLVFDMKRLVMTGFSVWPEKSDVAYYINLAHADVENRVPFHVVKPILDARTPESFWIAHNASFEMTAFNSAVNYDVSENMICSMQMATTAFGPDEYSKITFRTSGLGEMEKWKKPILALASGFNADTQEMSPELSEVVYKIIAKESDAAHSYNGFVKDIAYGYGLKKIVKSFFDHQMTTFEQVLGERAHMGQLTGEEVAAYGAEDAYWAVRVFYQLLEYMSAVCPKTIDTFFNQENPMVPVFSSIWQGGMKVNTEAITARRQAEREETANVLKKMKAVVKQLLPFPPKPHEVMFETEKAWYTKGWQKYRKSIEQWAALPDVSDPFEQVSQIRGAVVNAWREEKGMRESTGPNFSHYMPIRTLIYDLLQQKVIRSEGKVQSDGNSRGRLIDRLTKEDNKLGVQLIQCINDLAGIEQRMKLYLTPYSRLMDPDTGRMYPVVSCELATRRMAASSPNPMQLAKRGESTYVRGFFEPDYEDHVVGSLDLSGIELVIIGELSQDPEFIKAFGQLPHADLHSGAAADILSVDVPGLKEDHFLALKSATDWAAYGESANLSDIRRLRLDLKGQDLSPDKAYKYWRTEIGKGANFNYWYSGWLATVGERLGWTSDQTKLATERYRDRFSVAESWRTNTISMGQRDGYVTLPDELRRVRYEATMEWNEIFQAKWSLGPGVDAREYYDVIRWIARKIAKRSNNQLVNALVQGTCATIIKRSVIRALKEAKLRQWDKRIIRFMIPIHDELVYSFHKDYVVECIAMVRQCLIEHADLFKACVLDSTPAIGLTFEPWHEKKAPLGQIELFEAPRLSFLPEARWGKKLNDNEIKQVVDHLFEQRKAA
jgi:DNA polymerase I-like protein with 3'-5' exonuclease and polymerase domains